MTALKRLHWLFWLLTLTSPQLTVAQPNFSGDELAELSQSERWHKLLHYQSGWNPNHVKSQVDNQNFFLSPKGKTQPLAELEATLQGFYQAVEEPNQHPLCRFPARWNYLQAELKLPKPPMALKQCPEFNQWFNTIQPHSVTLVFASSYLNSPSSMFGHTLFRIDPEGVESGSKWLSYAVNFGARSSPEDNSLLYAYKGLFGGYPGYFGIIRYFEKIKEYSRMENRDLWEYNLNLSPEETRRMMTHLWELRDMEFDYYFFDENCSYRLLELLEVARPGVSLVDAFGGRAIPIDTVRAVADAGLLENISYRPSATTKLEHQIHKLNPQQQKTAWQLAHREIELDDPTITEMEETLRGQVISTAYEYQRYLALKSPRTQEAADHSLNLLKALSQLPTDNSQVPTPDTSPDQGHKTLLVAATGGQQDEQNFADLRLRLSYHDLVDNSVGYLKGAAINIGEMSLRKRESDSIQLEQFSVIQIQSHAPRSLFLDPITWRVQAGFERLYAENDNALAAQVHGGAGATFPLGEHTLLYGMAMARLEHNKLLDHNWAAGIGALAGAVAHLPFGTLKLESNYYQLSDDQQRYQHKLIQNIPIGRNNAVRLTASHQKQVEYKFDEFSLEFRHYF